MYRFSLNVLQRLWLRGLTRFATERNDHVAKQRIILGIRIGLANE